MKEKILMFIIGMLVGAIITAGCFLIIRKNNTTEVPNMENMQFRGGNGGFERGQMRSNGELPTNMEVLEKGEMPDNIEFPYNGQRPDNMQKSEATRKKSSSSNTATQENI